MAQLLKIELDCWKHPKGYRLETKPYKGLCVVPNGNPRDRLIFCRPLDTSQTLFRIFATTATTPEGVLKFVQSYGPVTMSGNDYDKGDYVPQVIRRAQIMQNTLKWLSAHPRQPPPDLDAGANFYAVLNWDPRTKKLRWHIRPSTLFDGLWLQFAQAVTRGVQIRTCMHCGDLFETGLGTRRRLDAKFCTDEHRIAFNSLKRSKEK